MRIRTLASSSSGNCTLVSQDDTHILIDCGISMRRVTEALRALDLTPGDLSGIVMTHAHADHICGLKMMAKYHAARVFATRITGEILCEATPELEKCMTLFDASGAIRIGPLEIRSFRTMHDAPESVGYRIEGGGKSLLFATDLGCVTREVAEAAKGLPLRERIGLPSNRENISGAPGLSSTPRKSISAPMRSMASGVRS